MSNADRDRHVAILLRTAEDLSDRRASVAERLLADRYFRLQREEDAVQGEWQSVNRERQDLENWLDIYQVPIQRMWDPDESASESDEDDDDFDIDDEFFALPEGSPVSAEDDNGEDQAPARHDESGSNRERDRSPEDRERGNRSDDEI